MGDKKLVMPQCWPSTFPIPPDELPAVSVASLRPGDVLVVRLGGPVSQRALENIGEGLADAFPGHKCVILEAGVSLDVVRPESADPSHVREG
jgi:hypothetical protein